jgi:hypothetical protein
MYEYLFCQYVTVYLDNIMYVPAYLDNRMHIPVYLAKILYESCHVELQVLVDLSNNLRKNQYPEANAEYLQRWELYSTGCYYVYVFFVN